MSRGSRVRKTKHHKTGYLQTQQTRGTMYQRYIMQNITYIRVLCSKNVCNAFDHHTQHLHLQKGHVLSRLSSTAIKNNWYAMYTAFWVDSKNVLQLSASSLPSSQWRVASQTLFKSMHLPLSGHAHCWGSQWYAESPEQATSRKNTSTRDQRHTTSTIYLKVTSDTTWVQVTSDTTWVLTSFRKRETE